MAITKQYSVLYSEYISVFVLYVIILSIVVPVFLLSPYLFNEIPLSHLSTLSLLSSLISFVVGIWFVVVVRHLKMHSAKNMVVEGLCSEIGVFFVLYLLFKGTQSMFGSLKREHL